MSESEFLDRIKRDPLDEQNRLEYLQWLENTDDHKARFARLKIEQLELQKKLIELETPLQNSSIGISEEWMDNVFPLYIRSPMVGRIYLQPAPDARSFISVGNLIKPGTIVARIEAMMILNDIESRVSGVVTEICVSDGQAVEYNQLLFRVAYPSFDYW